MIKKGLFIVSTIMCAVTIIVSNESNDFNHTIELEKNKNIIEIQSVTIPPKRPKLTMSEEKYTPVGGTIYKTPTYNPNGDFKLDDPPSHLSKTPVNPTTYIPGVSGGSDPTNGDINQPPTQTPPASVDPDSPLNHSSQIASTINSCICLHGFVNEQGNVVNTRYDPYVLSFSNKKETELTGYVVQEVSYIYSPFNKNHHVCAMPYITAQDKAEIEYLHNRVVLTNPDIQIIRTYTTSMIDLKERFVRKYSWNYIKNASPLEYPHDYPYGGESDFLKYCDFWEDFDGSHLH